MPIIYSLVARTTTILAKYAECVGNFAEVTEQILPKIQTDVNNKLTYSHGNYLIHYVCENKVIYMCITDDNFERQRAFLFLNEIKKQFITTYGLQIATAIQYAMNTEFSQVLAREMRRFSEMRSMDSIARVNEQIDEVRGIMVKSIENVAARGERLELLVTKTDNLRNNTVSFRNQSTRVARQMFWRNMRMYFVVGTIILFIIYVIISMACGGLLWQTCVNRQTPTPPN